MACARNYLPPYFRVGIFFFCGLELAWNAFVMAINQKFWDLSTKIFPVAFKMFNDTLLKGEPRDFVWTVVERNQLDMYQYKLTLMWLCSTITILYSMLCIVPQFCTMQQSDDSEITFCVKKPVLGYVMAPFLLVLVFFCGCALTWQWFTCEEDHSLFQNLFGRAQKEETFLSELETQLNCNTDDDKEVLGVWRCEDMVNRAMLDARWLDPLVYSFIICHIVMLFGFCIANREWEWRDVLFWKKEKKDFLETLENNHQIEEEKPMTSSTIRTNGMDMEKLL
ncbi:unnamed protein product [Bursaphelenchus xylophilus]|uniref:(pine wood nematode) hypothetical protein n=1 Tax=Bursaphelenchus xylophilus TaxID=6326 RepID=A0A7I8XAL9_BURXY|nr:unnamed protein product [Bursaphelenchus xylophilus]CAG9082466.1 unnamed protein product [Bursaphelenchus xylophilus]